MFIAGLNVDVYHTEVFSRVTEEESCWRGSNEVHEGADEEASSQRCSGWSLLSN